MALRGLFGVALTLAAWAVSSDATNFVAPDLERAIGGKRFAAVERPSADASPAGTMHAGLDMAAYRDVIFGAPVAPTSFAAPQAQTAILAATFIAPADSAPAAPAVQVASLAPAAATAAVAPEPVAEPETPLPPANPFRAKTTETTTIARATPRLPARAPKAQAVAAAPQEKGFFERIFGVKDEEPRTSLAYAPSQDDGISKWNAPAPSRRFGAGDRTAVYDISAKVVIMPDGRRLEAHSGLGKFMDDPRNVHLRMRGATPPNVYNLRMREALFHGVRAIRLTPVDNRKMFGRDGILAHTYMLGPRGDSNGCVSFRDYDAFLQAFLRGEVTRMVVVASSSSMMAQNDMRSGL